MTPPLRFCFGLHLHQPVGNFDSVFRDHLAAVYNPLLQGLEDGRLWPVTIHVSGPLLDWLERHAGEWVDRLGGHVQDGRIELLAAGHDEPILAALSNDDRIEQVLRHRERLQRRFGIDATGLWLTERVWESDLPRDLARAGVRFVVVDDRHLRVTGVPRHELHQPWVTEHDGHRLTVLAIDQRLRYLVPFRPVDELEQYFTELHEAGRPLAVLADDGEKFGGWPGTSDWVWRDGWFADFAARITTLQERGVLAMSTMAAAIAAIPSRGPVYLPSASYHEMERWALPPAQARRLEQLEEAPLLPDPGADDAALLRGSHWRNFLAKYPESNRLHKVAAHLSQLSRAAGDPPDVRSHIGRAQCNDAYWHGVFGGLYLPFLRAALWRELAGAASILHADESLTATVIDLDADGAEEIVVSSSQCFAVVAPARGACVEVLLNLATGHNLADTMTRHEEAYHPAAASLDGAVVADPTHDTATGTASIHDLETTLDFRPPLDDTRRALLVDRFVAPECTREDFVAGTVPVVRDLAHTALNATVHHQGGMLTIDGEGAGFRKQIRFDDTGRVTVTWEWNAPDAALHIDVWFTTELSLAVPVDIQAPGAERWDYAIETVAKSERGFDRTVQGEAVVLRWPASAGRAEILF